MRLFSWVIQDNDNGGLLLKIFAEIVVQNIRGALTDFAEQLQCTALN